MKSRQQFIHSDRLHFRWIKSYVNHNNLTYYAIAFISNVTVHGVCNLFPELFSYTQTRLNLPTCNCSDQLSLLDIELIKTFQNGNSSVPPVLLKTSRFNMPRFVVTVRRCHRHAKRAFEDSPPRTYMAWHAIHTTKGVQFTITTIYSRRIRDPAKLAHFYQALKCVHSSK